MKKTAIILGATGLTGSFILEKLINDDRYSTIKLFSRNKVKGTPSKVTQFIGNLLELENFKTDFTADEVFCCIGTTSKKTPDKSLYKKIDLGIPVTAAKLCKMNDISAFLVVSALGADASSSIFYNRTKGEMEQAVLAKKIKKTHILQPSIIAGNRKEKRIGEKIGLLVINFLQPLFFGKLRKYTVTDAEDIATVMIHLANSKVTKTRIISTEISNFKNN